MHLYRMTVSSDFFGIYTYIYSFSLEVYFRYITTLAVDENLQHYVRKSFPPCIKYRKNDPYSVLIEAEKKNLNFGALLSHVILSKRHE